MNLVITEKQLKEIVKLNTVNQQVSEQSAADSDSEPKPGTSSDGEKKTGATKWESGVSRGPANQIGITKWSDVVGASLKRGKANPLSEQLDLSTLAAPNPIATIMANDIAANDTPYKEYMTPWETTIKIPADATVKLWDSTMDRRKVISKNHIRESGNRVYWRIGYDKEIEDDVYELVTNEQLLMVLPDDSLRYFETKDGKLWTFVLTRTGVNKEDRSGIWTIKYKTFVYHPTPTAPYENYDSKKYINVSVSTKILQFFDEYGEVILQVVLSVVAGILTMGQSLWIQALAELVINAGFAIKQIYVDNNNFGAALSLMISIVPFASIGLRYGLGQSFKALSKYGPELSQAKTIGEAQKIIEKFDDAEQILIKKALSLPEATLKKAMSEGTMRIFTEGIKKGTLKIASIPFEQRTWLWQSMFELLGMSGILLSGIKYRKEMIERETEEMANLAESYWSPQNGFNTPEFKNWFEETVKKYDQDQLPTNDPENNK